MREQGHRQVALGVFGLAWIIGLVAAPVQAANASVESTLKSIDQVASAGPFRPAWESLAEFKVPKWYQDAKFGIFIHWGAYSVPGYGSEWYPREMYNANRSRRGIYQHHLQTYGKPSEFGYKDFIPMFKAEKFDAGEWAKLFKEAGARYVIPVAEHHDGFPMYDSDYTEWSAAKMGPKRDIIGELAKAVRDEGLTFGLSSHRVENWWFYGEGRKIDSDVTDERYRGLYGPARDRKESEDGKTPPDEAFLTDWLLRCCELVDKYEPQVIWFD
jgi:alpha-L-fucosidase